MARKQIPAGADARDEPAADAGDQTTTGQTTTGQTTTGQTTTGQTTIPAEGVAIERPALDTLAVHLDLDPGAVIAARQYPDRLVYVTRDGRKAVKDMR